MKSKTLLGLALVVALTFLCIFSCRRSDVISFKDFSKAKKKDLNDPDKALNVALAKVYYKMLKKEYGDKVATPQVLNDNRPNRKYLYWQKAYQSQTGKYTFTEVPLLYNRRTTSVLKKKGETRNKAQEDKIAKASFDRMLIYKNKNTSVVNNRILTYIPDYDYLQRHNFDVSSNHINNLDRDFSGFIQYKRWDGKILWTLRMKDGKSTNRYVRKPVNGNRTTGRETSEYCEDFVDISYTETCYYADPEGLSEWCEYEITDEYYHSDCWSDEGDPSDWDYDCGCYYTSEETDPPSVTNHVTNPCILAAIQAIMGDNYPNVISALFASTYTGTYNFSDLYLDQGNDFDASSYSTQDGNNDNITFNPAWWNDHPINGSVPPLTQEYWANSFAHELVHQFLIDMGFQNNVIIQHEVMLVSWVGAIATMMQQAYGMSLTDARALTLEGMGDVLLGNGYVGTAAEWNAFLQDHYGMSTVDAATLAQGYITGDKGTPCN